MSAAPSSLMICRTSELQRGWRIASAILLALVGVFFAYWPSAFSLIEVWADTAKTTYTHGSIIAALTIWLVWRKRARLASVPWSPSFPASLSVAMLGLAWLVAVHAGIELIHQLLLLALLWFSVWALFGRRMALLLWFPVGYLIFAIPAWDQINFLLQGATVKAVALLLKVTSIPAYVDGNLVHLAAGVFEVAGGCSGIHFFIVALALASLYGEVGDDPMKVRIRLMALGGALALLANWLRVYIIVVAGYLTNMQHPLIKQHYNFGWAVFAVTMTIFFLLARRFVPAAKGPAPVAAAPAGSRRVAPGIAIATVCMLAAPASELLRPSASASLASNGITLPKSIPGWDASSGFSSPWNPVFAGADREASTEYANAAGSRVQLFVASYATQRANKEMVTYGNALIGPGDGSVISESGVASGVARELVVQGGQGRSVIHFYYDVDGHRADRGIVAQFWYGLTSLRRQPGSSVVALRTACASDCDAARALLNEFSTSMDEQGMNTR
ncbi:MAG: exosortase A [Pseudomonadota bacterium]